MADDKIKKEELKDEELNKAAGGAYVYIDPSKQPKVCANPQCNTALPYGYTGKYCKKCIKDFGDSDASPIGRPAPVELP